MPIRNMASLPRHQASVLTFRIWRPRYMPVFRSMWCGRRNSPESLSSTYVGFLHASCERRMPRFAGEVFRFGTAMMVLECQASCANGFELEAALIEDASRCG